MKSALRVVLTMPVVWLFVGAAPSIEETKPSRPDTADKQSQAARDKAIAEIERMGGKVQQKTSFAITLSGPAVTDESLGKLLGVTNLTDLDLSDANVTDAGLTRIQALKSLQILDLSFTKVTDAGLAHLKALANLEELDLAGPNITDAGLKQIGHARKPTRNRPLWVEGHRRRTR